MKLVKIELPEDERVVVLGGVRHHLVTVERPHYSSSVMVSLQACASGYTARVLDYRIKLVTGLIESYPVVVTIDSVLAMLNEKYPVGGMSVLDLEVVHDAVNGLWSGFPLCCVWDFAVNDNSGWKMTAKHGELNLGYVVCDDCVDAGRKVAKESIQSGYIRYWENGTWTFRA